MEHTSRAERHFRVRSDHIRDLLLVALLLCLRDNTVLVSTLLLPTLYVPDLEAGDVDLGVGWSLPDTCTING